MKSEHHLEFELLQLERRLLLAGNVEVKVSGGGDLSIRGDGEDNRILVSENASGEVTVRGMDGTRIQLGSTITGVVTVADVTDDVKINLRGGNNTLLIPNLTVPDDLSVRTGGGRDVIALARLNVGDDVSIVTGGGSDDVWQMFSSAAEDVAIRTGSGNDSVTLGSSNQSKLSVATGGGDDEIILVANSFFEEMAVRAGGGNDFVYSINSGSGQLNGGGGFDTFNTESRDAARSFESDAIQAVAVAFAADIDLGATDHDGTFAKDRTTVDAFAATRRVVATADTYNGVTETDVNVDQMGLGFAIASIGTDYRLESSIRL